MPKKRLDTSIYLNVTNKSQESSINEELDTNLFSDVVKSCNIKYTSNVLFIRELLPIDDIDPIIPYFFYTYSNEISTDDYKRLFGFSRFHFRPIFETNINEFSKKGIKLFITNKAKI